MLSLRKGIKKANEIKMKKMKAMKKQKLCVLLSSDFKFCLKQSRQTALLKKEKF
jgi:hypothetical protein